jgi:hypothetical protein
MAGQFAVGQAEYRTDKVPELGRHGAAVGQYTGQETVLEGLVSLGGQGDAQRLYPHGRVQD